MIPKSDSLCWKALGLVASLVLSGLLLASDHGETDAEEVKIAVLVNDLGNPYFQALASSVRDTARAELGPQVRVSVESSGYDVARQRRQIRAARDSGVNLLILTAAHPDELEPVVRELRDEGVAVVAVDVATQGAQITITTHNVEAGFFACQHMAESLNREGRVAILDGPPVSSIGERMDGCEAALRRYPRIDVVDRVNSGASDVGGVEAMTRLLTRHQDLDAVFSINDPASRGAESAARFQGRTDIRIASVDGSPALAEALQEEDTLYLNTAAQFPWRIGEEAVLRGLSILQTGDTREETVLIPVELIHRDNAHLYCDWRRCDTILD